MDSKEYYTSGELAKLVGLSYKSIRVYVDRGLLIPDNITEAGYKLFSEKSVERLQKIIMFKYLDFSLEEISRLLDEDDISESFNRQSELIDARITHLTQIKSAVNEIKGLSENNRWDKMLEIMRLTSQREEVINQYVKTDNLDKRINIHKYSTSPIEWFDYLLNVSKLEAGMNILDIGCGTGKLWYKCRNDLPSNINIYMVDNSEAMINSAKMLHLSEINYYRSKNINLYYYVCDATRISEIEEINKIKYQRIMCNHMLYHLEDSDRRLLFDNVSALLTEDGRLVASTIGSGHMKEMFELAKEFDNSLDEPEWFSSGFDLENGAEQLKLYFAQVDMYLHDNNLIVPDWKVVYDYLCTLPGGISKVLNRRKNESINFFRNKVTEDNPFFISKRTGIFLAGK